MPSLLYKRSRSDYPKGVIGIYDNAGQSNETTDHYMVVFAPYIKDTYKLAPNDGRLRGKVLYPVICMSDTPYSPQGVCMRSTINWRPTGGWQAGIQSAGKTISFNDLPRECQRVVREELRE